MADGKCAKCGTAFHSEDVVCGMCGELTQPKKTSARRAPVTPVGTGEVRFETESVELRFPTSCCCCLGSPTDRYKLTVTRIGDVDWGKSAAKSALGVVAAVAVGHGRIGVTREQEEVTFELPICRGCRSHARNHTVAWVIGFVLGLGVPVGLYFLVQPKIDSHPGSLAPVMWVVGAAVIWCLAAVGVRFALKNQLVRLGARCAAPDPASVTCSGRKFEFKIANNQWGSELTALNVGGDA